MGPHSCAPGRSCRRRCKLLACGAITFIAGTTLAVSGFAVAAVLSSDYTRYCKSRKDTLISTILGVLPTSILVLAIGGVLSVTTGSYDLTLMFSNMGLPFVGLLCLILATWTTNCGNAYSGGIAIVGILNLKDDKRAIVTLIAGAIGTVLAIVGIMNFFTPFLNFISLLVPPMAGIAIADYWILGRGNKVEWKPFAGVNWLGLGLLGLRHCVRYHFQFLYSDHKRRHRGNAHLHYTDKGSQEPQDEPVYQINLGVIL